MNEKFLHYVWKLQYFDKKELKTSSGDNISILHQGTYNTDSGPDFLNAKIKIGDITWFGNIEIHVRSSDWELHHHSDDSAYNNVILHVVYTNDEPVRRDNGSMLPVLELNKRISEELIIKYKQIELSPDTIPCAGQLQSVEEIYKVVMTERALMQRLEQKSVMVRDLLQANNHDWLETTYQVLARNFGFKINSEPFLKLAQRVPLKNLLKQRDSLFKMESILFGQSGLLDQGFEDDYPQKLLKEYQFQGRKYCIDDKKMEACEWRFLRVRPANFPSIRIAEFSSLLFYSPEIISNLFEITSYEEVKKYLSLISLSEYWKDHYVFDSISEGKKGNGIGEESIRSIVINTLVPVIFAYGKINDSEVMIERAISLLHSLPSEKNKIINSLLEAGFQSGNAFDSQGLLELYHSWCSKRNCLRCEIGNRVLMEGVIREVY